MSTHFSWQSAVLASELESSTKLVLMVIGSYMNQHGAGAFPSYATIAKGSSLNRATVIRHVELAVVAGWLAKRQRMRAPSDNGKPECDTNLYEVAYPVVAQDDHLVAQDDQGSRTERPGVVAQSDPNTPSLSPQLTPHLSTDQAFDLFWRAGLPKTGKKPALTKFKALVKKLHADPAELAQRLASDVRARLAAKQYGFDKLHPTTYLYQERWEDEAPRLPSSTHTNFGEKTYVGTAEDEIDWLNPPGGGGSAQSGEVR